MTRTYRIRRGDLISLTVFSGLWFAFVIGVALFNLPDRVTQRLPVEILAVVLFALWPALATAGIPHEVAVADDGTCTFKSRIRTRTVKAHRIISISVDDDEVVLRHDRGKIRFRLTEDFAGLAWQLRQFNPAIKY